MLTSRDLLPTLTACFPIKEEGVAAGGLICQEEAAFQTAPSFPRDAGS